MSASNNQSTWQERPSRRLIVAVLLLTLLNVILFLGGWTSKEEVIWPTIMVATFLALGELALRISKKYSKNTDEKLKHHRKKRSGKARIRDVFGLLAMLALGALYLWVK